MWIKPVFVGIDPGATIGVAVKLPGKLLVASVFATDDALSFIDRALLGRESGDVFVAIEQATQVHSFGGTIGAKVALAKARNLMATCRMEGALVEACRGRGWAVATVEATKWRTMFLGKPQANDGLVRAAFQRECGTKARTNNHGRDAYFLARYAQHAFRIEQAKRSQ